MAIASYTLQSDGLAVRSDTGTIFQEWWSQSPTSTVGLGSFYQARAVIISTDSNVANSGTFNAWVSLVEGQTWSVDSGVDSFGATEIQLQIRRVGDSEVLGSAVITLGVAGIPAQQEYVWLMDEGDLNRFRYFGGSRSVLSSPISLAIGDTISFTWISSASTGTGDYILSSSSGATNQSFVRSTGTNLFDIQGFTVTVDGASVINGDAIPTQSTGVERFDFICTATIATDIQFFNSDNVVNAGSRGQNPIYDLVINNGTVFTFPMQTFGATSDADTGGSGVTITFTDNFNALFWRSQPFADSTGVQTTSLPPSDTATGTANINTNQPSMLVSGAGSAINYGTNSSQLNRKSISIAYQNGFTIEGAVKVDVLSNFDGGASTNGRAGAFIDSLSNAISLWTLRFDNFADGSTTNTFPCFTLLSGLSYITPASYTAGNFDLDLRGTTALVIGNVYHIMATIRPSDNTAELWINGVSVASGSVPPDWYTFGLDSLLDGSQETLISAGSAWVNSANRRGSTTIQNIQIHLQEATDAFALQQASLVNFT